MKLPKNNDEKINNYCNVIFILLIGIILGAVYGMIYESHQISEKLDEYFEILYEKEIYPIGESEIQNFVMYINNLTSEKKINESEKYQLIADFVTNNFTEYYWERDHLNNTDYNFKSFSSLLVNYGYDEYGNVRAVFLSPYNNDPAWIAYYRTGACGELASLFGNITNRTGTPVNMVVAKFKNGGNHAWVELILDNGERKYFDPTVYGEYFNFKLHGYGSWFGNTSEYKVFSAENIAGIYEYESNEEVTWRYDLLQNKPDVNIKKIDAVINEIGKNINNVTKLFA